MKKKRFGLLTKIILLTGLLTILTVSTSLAVNLLISYNERRNSYISSCTTVTDNLESVFVSSDTSKDKTIEILDMVVESYETVRDNYETLNQSQIDAYQKDLSTTIFGANDGSFGMTLEKAARKTFYSESLSNMQYICSTSEVPFATFVLFDTGKQRVIEIIRTNFKDIDADGGLTIIDKNLANIGLVVKEIDKKDLNFFNGGKSFETFVSNDMVYSYNLVEINTSDSNYKCFVQGQYPLAAFSKDFTRQLVAQLIITFASAIFLVIIYSIFTKLFLIRNVESLTASTKQFVSKMEKDEPLEIVDSKVKSTDEIRELSDSFTVMQEQIITYVENIKKAKDIEQAFKTEVDVASKIQLESLPARSLFDRNLELRAFIEPAKGVGGDFYDYFYIDEDRLAVVIADVSGKGIPASLFMMRSKESLRSAAMNEKDLATVFFKVNNSLCVNNKEGFFVTAFLGVLNLKTLEFNYVSAGHERPFIKHKGECKRMEVKSNFVLGLEEDFIYEQEKVKLDKEDTIFLYTDGLNEAINANKEEFGYDRIEASLEKDDELKLNIETVINDLEEFRGEEEQFDDITIVAFNIKNNVTTFQYKNPKYEDILDLTSKVEQCLEDFNPATISKIGIVIDEVMNNIISYGRTKTNKALSLSVIKTEDGVTLVFVDNSHPFNPLLKEEHTIPENMEKGIVGGVGISIIKSITKEAEYTYSNNKNILVIKF